MSERIIRGFPDQFGEFMVPICITQETVNQLAILIAWLEGMQRVQPTVIPGEHELIMHYRELRQALARVKESTDA